MTAGGNASGAGGPAVPGLPVQRPDSAETWHRVHPVSPLVRGWIALVAIIYIAGREQAELFLNQGAEGFEDFPFLWVSLALLATVLVVGTAFYLSWRFTRYQLTAEHVRVHSGVVFRQQRQARLDRVQAIDVIQPLLARIFGLAELRFEVADAGVGFVPEDRNVDGLVGTFSVAENLVLNRYDEAPFARGLSMKPAVVGANADEKIAEYDIRTQSAAAAAGTLSGGNQQKVVMARELSRPLSLFIASQPTRGVDVGSIEFLHRRIVAEREVGTPVMIVSTELDEVLELGDRIAVLYGGRLMGIVPAGTSRNVLGLMMAGMHADEALAREAASEETQTEGGAQ